MIPIPGDGPWPAAIEVAQRLLESGYETYFAGGCVRDLLLGEPVHDIDIATAAVPEVVESLFERTITVGKQFGIIIVQVPAGGETVQAVEVATFRGDGVYADGRHPGSVRFTSACEDAQRRDFTINALLMDPRDGRISDHVGGLDDIRGRILRCVGDPRARLHEDRLRVLRGLRFAARFGLTIEPVTRAALGGTALDGLSRERIWQEFDKGSAMPTAAAWAALLIACGHAAAMLPAGARAPDAPAMGRVHGSGLPVRLAAWLWKTGPCPEAWWQSQPLSRQVQRASRWLLEQRHAIDDAIGWRRAAFASAAEGLPELLHAVDGARHAACCAAYEWLASQPPLLRPDGATLQSLGVAVGPAIGRIQRDLIAFQLESGTLAPADLPGWVGAWLVSHPR